MPLLIGLLGLDRPQPKAGEGLRHYLAEYNNKRPHQGRGMNGRTPAAVFKAGLPKQTKKEKIAA